ncbi:MAG: glutamine--tRNA ligase/YqeY domain fusion protein [Anaerolineales bacterium]|nr:glutamine--tRNA ligase/YqeY domain fusion protein [Anaerolineales bacterium]
MTNESNTPSNFIRTMIDEHLESGRFDRVHTRFPPEPNGYLHLGHTKAICLNIGIAADYKGKFNMRFDDTNPTKEEQEYVDAILEDVKWLGGDWEDRLFYASDYFDQLYEWAIQLIKDGKAYVDDLSADEIREYRGTLTSPGKNSPYRGRSVEENLDLFERMRAGEFPDGTRVLRAKIDMSDPNMNMRDPVMYRILHEDHHRTGDKWCIYPTYDWTHGQSDSIEGITHSLCTLEYEAHRPLYEWYIEQLGLFMPQQIEFAPLVLSYTMFSKRRLIRLVQEGYVNGWDDPRLPTISGIRRRGVPAEAIRNFCDMIGVSKANSMVDLAMFEHAIRDDLNFRADRAMAVLDPLKVVITNYPEGQTETFEIANNPADDSNDSTHTVPFTREIYIEQEDFREEANKKYNRMAPGRIIRLMGAYLVTCEGAVKDDEGHIVEIHCTYHPETKGGYAVEGLKPKGTIHWVSAVHAKDAEVRLYEPLFTVENPLDTSEGKDFTDYINPDALVVIPNAKIEPSLHGAAVGSRYQFLRMGYFAVDPDSTAEKMVFNRTVGLRDTWANK